MTVAITQIEASYSLNEDWELVCDHLDAEIERACCSGRDSEGNPSCGCHGMDGVLCPNPDCTGLTDHDVELILFAAEPDFDY